MLGRGRMKAAASTGDALYFRVRSNRQTTENQLTELLAIAHKDSHQRAWDSVRANLGRCILTETRLTQYQVSGVDPAMPPNP